MPKGWTNDGSPNFVGDSGGVEDIPTVPELMNDDTKIARIAHYVTVLTAAQRPSPSSSAQGLSCPSLPPHWGTISAIPNDPLGAQLLSGPVTPRTLPP